MSDYVQKEKYEGVYFPTAETIKFNRTWGGHRFTDEECRILLAGESITFTAHSDKKKKDFTAHGRLEFQTYSGHDFWGFSLSDAVPDSFSGHTFTEEEKQALEKGEYVYAEDFVSKAGKRFSASVVYKDDENGRKKIFMEFNAKNGRV